MPKLRGFSLHVILFYNSYLSNFNQELIPRCHILLKVFLADALFLKHYSVWVDMSPACMVVLTLFLLIG